MLIRKCLQGKLRECAEKRFIIRNHEQKRRKKAIMLEIPKVRLKTVKSDLLQMGVKIYKSLPMISSMRLLSEF